MKNTLKNLLILILPIIIGIISSLFGYWDINQENFLLKLTILITLNALYAIILLLESISEAKKINKAFDRFFGKSSTIVFGFVKNFTLQFFSIILSIFCSIMGDWSKCQPNYKIKFYLIVGTSALYIIIIIIFSIIEARREKFINKVILLRKVSIDTVSNATYILEDILDYLYKGNNINQDKFSEIISNILWRINDILEEIEGEKIVTEYIQYNPNDEKIIYITDWPLYYEHKRLRELDMPILKDLQKSYTSKSLKGSRLHIYTEWQIKNLMEPKVLPSQGFKLYNAYPIYNGSNIIGMIKMVYFDSNILLKPGDLMFLDFHLRDLYEDAIISPFKSILYIANAMKEETNP